MKWAPRTAPHIKGLYTRRTFNGGMPEPQKVRAHCTTCDTKWEGSCSTGRVRTHIAKFAIIHMHRDPLKAERIVHPNSMRLTEKDKRQ